jgi:hypothetical protein
LQSALVVAERDKKTQARRKLSKSLPFAEKRQQKGYKILQPVMVTANEKAATKKLVKKIKSK